MHLSYLEALTSMKFRLLNPHKELDFESMEQGKGEEYSATISAIRPNVSCVSAGVWKAVRRRGWRALCRKWC